jgi:hypothetical protein
MPFGEVRLIPGVNVERTPTLLEAGFSQSSLIRFLNGLVQKLGGWAKFFNLAVPGVPRDLHAWQDLNALNHLAVGTTTTLSIITSSVRKDITPQTLISDFAPNISTTSGSTAVSITDPNVSGVTTYDSIFFNVPISIGGLILFGLYPIALITGASSYNITAATAATTTETNPTATNNTTAAGNPTLHFAATPAWVVAGMSVADLTTPTSIPASTIVLSTTGTTVVMSNNAAGAGVGNGDNIVFCSIPVFTTANNSAIVVVTLIAHGVALGNNVNFPIATTGNAVTIKGTYAVIAVADANHFSITASNQANASSSFTMNGGSAELVYYIALGPPSATAGYGLGGYGSGGYGTGTGTSGQTGTPITATDWTSDNWGQLLVACPSGGGIYVYDPTGGFVNASVVSSAPPFNGGIFVSVSQQILFAWATSVNQAIGVAQDPMEVGWSTVGDYTVWNPLPSNQAGKFRIPIGSRIVGGMAVANENLFWTDLDLWAANYSGPPFVFGFNKIGAGAGLISSHAAQQLRGGVQWMGPSNFYRFTGNGVEVIPCPVWDFVFQNLNTAFAQNVRALPNTPFNEAGWAFPSLASNSGENDSYVKYNITEPGQPWDYGPVASMPRSAWIDQTVLGNPIGATPTGLIYQHEMTNDADSAPLVSSFTTGYFVIAEGEDFAFVKQIIPDFKWGLFGGAQGAAIQLSFNVVNYPGDTPRVYGPYTVTVATRFITVHFRGRQMSITVTSSDLGSFWRLGNVRYLWQADGRR